MLLRDYCFVLGNFLHECVAVVGVVHFATVVLKSVTYNEIVYFKYEVVSCYLRECVFVDGYTGGFVFDNNSGNQVFIVYNGVAS